MSKYEIDLGLKQLKLYDQRFYEIPTGEKFPSVTTILNAKSKGYALEKWMRSIGLNYEKVMDEYAESGSKVHDACERLMLGETLTFLNFDGEEQYKFHEEWKKILRFKDWFTSNKVKCLLTEQTVYSRYGEYAGTMDLICTIGNDTWIIDLKSGGNVGTGYKMQIAAYYKAVHELEEFKIKPTKAGILTLGNDTKKGWRLTEVDNIDYMYECFQAVKTIWEVDNQNFEMIEKTYPTEIKLGGANSEA